MSRNGFIAGEWTGEGHWFGVVPEASADCTHSDGFRVSTRVAFCLGDASFHCRKCGRFWLMHGEKIRECTDGADPFKAERDATAVLK